MARYSSEQIGFIKDRSRVVVGNCKAGSGKTTVLRGYAKHNPQERILYLVFGRANRDEAIRKFPDNTTVLTCNQLAFQYCGHEIQHKLSASLRLRDIKDFLGIGDWGVVKKVMEGVQAFMASADDAPSDQHCDGNAGIVELVFRVWKAMADPRSSFPATHDVYLKQFQLQNLDLSVLFDTVLLDEFQDTNPVTARIVLNQPKCKLRLVGDQFQQMYRFRGAVNAVGLIEHLSPSFHHLTTSYRFGPAIADLANKLLWHLGNEHPLKGLPSINSMVVSRLDPLPSHYTCLQRTVAGTIEAALACAKSQKTMHWVGGIKSYNIDDMLDIYFLSKDEHSSIKNKRILKEYSNFYQYRVAASESGDHEMGRNVRIIDDYPNLQADIETIHRFTVPSARDADVILTTVHRAKGMEWPVVRLSDDFLELFNADLGDLKVIDELNLAYVAVTRAINVLELNTQIQVLLSLHNEEVSIFERREELFSSGMGASAKTTSRKRSMYNLPRNPFSRNRGRGRY